MTSIYKYGAVILMASLISACGGQPKEDAESNKQSHLTSKVSSELQTIVNEFTPESLEEAEEGVDAQSKVSAANADDVCEGIDFFQCQARLTRHYHAYVKANIIITRLLVLSTGIHLGFIADGSSGVHVTPEGDEVHYSKVSGSMFEILVKTESGPALYLSTLGSIYKIKIDFTNDPDRGEDTPDQLETTIVYNGRNDWTVESTATSLACNPDKVDDPENVRFFLRKSGDYWKGKVMLYSSVAYMADKSELTCENRDEQDPAHEGVISTDLVADRLAVKGSLYATDADVALQTSDISSAALNEICQNYPNLEFCQNISEETEAWFANNPNPYCLRAGLFSIFVDYGNNCFNQSPALAQEAFGAHTDWITPSELKNAVITLPEEL